jgi:hypothetical protein
MSAVKHKTDTVTRTFERPSWEDIPDELKPNQDEVNLVSQFIVSLRKGGEPIDYGREVGLPPVLLPHEAVARDLILNVQRLTGR